MMIESSMRIARTQKIESYLSPKFRPPMKAHGGKYYLARWIIDKFPEHKVFVSPYVFGGSVELNKQPSPVEIIGDINPDVISFWRWLQTRPKAVGRYLDRIEYTDNSFKAAKLKMSPYNHGDPTKFLAAMNFIVSNRMSRDGLGEDFSWSERLRGKKQPGGPKPGDANAWDTFRLEIPRYGQRIEHWQLYCKDALALIREWMSHQTLYYLDPPYHPDTRSAKTIYKYDYTAWNHYDLLRTITDRGFMGKVFISGYTNPMYESILKGWTVHRKEMPNHSAQTKVKQRRVECLWESPDR